MIEDTRQRYRIFLKGGRKEAREALHTFLAKEGEFEIVSEQLAGIERIATVSSDCVDLAPTDELTDGRPYSIQFGEDGVDARNEHVSIELIHQDKIDQGGPASGQAIASINGS